MVQYLLSVHSTDADTPPAPEVMEKIYARVDTFNEEVKASGNWVFGGGLHPVTTAFRISSISGRRKISPPVRSAQVMFGFSRTNATTSSVVSSSVGFRCQMLHVLQRYWHQ